MLLDVLKRIIKKTEVTKSVNKNNADHGILFEATNLIIHYGKQIPETFNNDVVKLLGIFISVREPNLKYLQLCRKASQFPPLFLCLLFSLLS